MLWVTHTLFVLDLPSSIKDWKSSWYRAYDRWDTMEGDSLAPLIVPIKFFTFSEFTIVSTSYICLFVA